MDLIKPQKWQPFFLLCCYLVKLFKKIHEKILQSFEMSLIYHSAAEERINSDITDEYKNLTYWV